MQSMSTLACIFRVSSPAIMFCLNLFKFVKSLINLNMKICFVIII